jgi:hypothetical protein
MLLKCLIIARESYLLILLKTIEPGMALCTCQDALHYNVMCYGVLSSWCMFSRDNTHIDRLRYNFFLLTETKNQME